MDASSKRISNFFLNNLNIKMEIFREKKRILEKIINEEIVYTIFQKYECYHKSMIKLVFNSD